MFFAGLFAVKVLLKYNHTAPLLRLVRVGKGECIFDGVVGLETYSTQNVCRRDIQTEKTHKISFQLLYLV